MAGRTTFRLSKKNIQLNFENNYWKSRGAANLSKGIALGRLRGAQTAMFQVFLNSSVTKELAAGPKSRNISNTIQYSVSKGNPNLYTFFGFKAGLGSADSSQRTHT